MAQSSRSAAYYASLGGGGPGLTEDDLAVEHEEWGIPPSSQRHPAGSSQAQQLHMSESESLFAGLLAQEENDHGGIGRHALSARRGQGRKGRGGRAAGGAEEQKSQVERRVGALRPAALIEQTVESLTKKLEALPAS